MCNMQNYIPEAINILYRCNNPDKRYIRRLNHEVIIGSLEIIRKLYHYYPPQNFNQHSFSIIIYINNTSYILYIHYIALYNINWGIITIISFYWARRRFKNTYFFHEYFFNDMTSKVVLKIFIRSSYLYDLKLFNGMNVVTVR